MLTLTMTMKLLVRSFLPIALLATIAQAQGDYECTLSSPIEIEDGVTLQQVKNSAADTYTMRLSYTGGQAWIGIGINTDGDNKMTPGTAVIGRLEDDNGALLRYSNTR